MTTHFINDNIMDMKKVATMVYLMRGRKILFLIRNKKDDPVHRQGVYIPLGGKVEDNEGVLACAVRETKEESGLIVSDLKLRGVINYLGGGKNGDDWTSFLFVGSSFEGEPIDGNEGQLVWVEREELASLDLYPGDTILLKNLFAYSFFVMDMVDCQKPSVTYDLLTAIE
jgi:8-oxo-dGTP diphosphatase